MSVHLPECWATDQIDRAEPLCICDRLRACEARVNARWESGGPWFRVSKVEAYERALDAARNAVAALLGKTVPPSDGVTEALAAIDALRGTG